MPAQKKDPSIRARTNRASTARTVSRDAGEDREVPDLPAHPSAQWHAETLRWWHELWTSPLPDAWEQVDTTSVITLALCFNDIWVAESAKERREAMSEYRLQRRDFFIAPYNRLQGEIVFEQADEMKSRGSKRRGAPQQPVAQPKAADDPRVTMFVVK